MDEERHMSHERMLTKSLRANYLILGDLNRNINPWVHLSNQARNYDALSQRESAPIADRAIRRSSIKIDTIHDVLYGCYIVCRP